MSEEQAPTNETLHSRLLVVEDDVTELKKQREAMSLSLNGKINSKEYYAALAGGLLIVLGMFYYVLDRQDKGFELVYSQISAFSDKQALTNENVAKVTSTIESVNEFFKSFNWTSSK